MEKLEQILYLEYRGAGKTSINGTYREAIGKSADIISFADTIPGLETDRSAALDNTHRAFEQIVSRDDLTAITLFDKNYPARLNVMGANKPPILYVKGDPTLLGDHGTAVVGTRNPSRWTQRVEPGLIRRIVHETKKPVISGLAIGCDHIAHEQTIRNGGKTIAVLPSGVDMVVPSSQEELAQRILESGGCLVSEYPPDTVPFKFMFVERDALTAALSDAVIGVEFSRSGGTMHTMQYALSYDRPVGCYSCDSYRPGNYTGNEYLISSRKAASLRSGTDLSRFLQDSTRNRIPGSSAMRPHQMTLDELF